MDRINVKSIRYLFLSKTRVYEYEGSLRFSMGDDYQCSPTSVLAFLRGQASVEILAKKSWLLTDDYQAEFKFNNHDFVLCTPSDSIDIFPINDAPDEAAKQLYRELDKFQGVGVLRWLSTWLYLLLRPFNCQL